MLTDVLKENFFFIQKTKIHSVAFCVHHRYFQVSSTKLLFQYKSVYEKIFCRFIEFSDCCNVSIENQ